MIDSPPNLDWESFDIRAAFGDYFNQKTFVTNDANAAALGEKSYGIAKDMDDFVETLKPHDKFEVVIIDKENFVAKEYFDIE